VALAIGGCGSLSGGLHADALAVAAPRPTSTEADTPAPAAPALERSASADTDAAGAGNQALAAVAAAAARHDGESAFGGPELVIESIGGDDMPPLVLALADSMLLAQAQESRPSLDTTMEEYDPLEKFNEAMFEFNLWMDRYLIKPVAKAYNFVMPDELQRMVSRGFSNVNFVPRVVNNLLQAKWAGAGREVARFLINSTVGIGGLWDMAKQEWDIQASKADFGQTLGKWGAGPGAYLVLPFLPPLTVRDGIGYAVDGALDPLSYVLPFIWDRLGMRIGDMINERSLNLDLFQGFEETTVDFYAAVRNAYLQRRYRLIHEE
jgi:phospholipid-binding lipoprotein MlaA